MKLLEIFDSAYYDELQHQMKMKQTPGPTNETSQQDFIISAYEAGELTYEQALAELKKVTPKDEMFFWDQELHMARELKD